MNNVSCSCIPAGKRIIRLLTLILIFGNVFNPCNIDSQESVLHAYQQSFIRASLDQKAEILIDAAVDPYAASFLGYLYNFALNFVLSNKDFMSADPQMIYLAEIAIKGAGEAAYIHSVETLCNVFQAYSDSSVRTRVMESLAVLGKSNRKVINFINQYLSDQNKLRFSMINIDYATVSASISALLCLGDNSSLIPVFGAVLADYSPAITKQATEALNALPGDYLQFMLNIILNNLPDEKFTAFTAAAGNSRLTIYEQGHLAQIALEQGLDYQPANIQQHNVLASLRYAAILELTRLQWTNAEHLVIRHFYRVQNDFQRAYAAKERYLQGIACLGAMGTSEAAIQAAFQLSFINSQTEKKLNYDSEITLAFINVLKTIRDSTAADPLFRIEVLPYNEEIKAAAKHALNNLRW